MFFEMMLRSKRVVKGPEPSWGSFWGGWGIIVISIVVLFVALACTILVNPLEEIALDAPSAASMLLEGRVFATQLKDSTWTAMGYEQKNDVPIVLNSLDETQEDLYGPPIKYRLSEAAFQRECPFNGNNLSSMGDALLSHASKVASFFSEWGANPIGCAMFRYNDDGDLGPKGHDGTSSSQPQYALHFDSSVHKLLNTNNKTLDSSIHVSSFYSNFNKRHLSSPMHSTMAHSKAVQCVGTKTWYFLEPGCCNDFRHILYSGVLLGNGFPPNAHVRVVQTRPGDVLVFSPFWHHIVVTEAGPAFLQTYRYMGLKVFLTSIHKFGFAYLTAIYDKMKNPRQPHHDKQNPHRGKCTNSISSDDMAQLHSRSASLDGL